MLNAISSSDASYTQGKNMNSDNANQLSDEFEAALSEILPDLVQLLQRYQVSSTLEIDLEPQFLNTGTMTSCTCCWVDRTRYRCGLPGYNKIQQGALGLDPAKAEQLSKDIQSKLSTVVQGLSSSVEPTNNSFAVHFVVNPAITNSEQSVICQWDNNSSQGGILQCSNS